MTIYDLKPQFQNLLRPIVRLLAKMSVTPNQVTVATCLFSIAIGLLVLTSGHAKAFYVLPVFFFIRMAFNAIDGMLAKEHNMQTKLGVILNEMTDVVSDGFLYYAFTALPFISQPLLHFVIFFAAVSELTGLAAVLNGKPRVYVGPSGKSDRAFIFGFLGILVGLNLTTPRVYNSILGIVAVLLLITIVNRTKKAI
ncbi:MAG: CDP-alcohol phosphatidyltransferase family protein [Bacteriovorax sp.]|nr:CDP-alcohol phosphatidyltransferase family protein [Bacteriovorax sp.]